MGGTTRCARWAVGTGRAAYVRTQGCAVLLMQLEALDGAELMTGALGRVSPPPPPLSSAALPHGPRREVPGADGERPDWASAAVALCSRLEPT